MTLTPEVGLIDTVERILRDHCTGDELGAMDRDGWSQPLWSALAGSGLPWVGVPEESGGSGGTLADSAALVSAVGRYGAPVPLAETGMLAGWALSSAGLHVPQAALTVVPSPLTLEARRDGDDWIIDGVSQHVPWARCVDAVTALCTAREGTVVAAIPVSALQVTPVSSIAGEPRDTVQAASVRLSQFQAAVTEIDAQEWNSRGALARSISMSGSLSRVLALSLDHVKTRIQFGRPLAAFQAVQDHIVRLAEHVALAQMATDTAVACDGDYLSVATAKVVTGEAARVGASLAHQLHGAMGMTLEHSLQRFTRRLLAYRQEFGNSSTWASRLASSGVEIHDDRGLWTFIAG